VAVGPSDRQLRALNCAIRLGSFRAINSRLSQKRVGWNVIVRRPSKPLPGKGFKAQADRAATNGGTLEARRAGTSTAA
jgi:hypothetical protein